MLKVGLTGSIAVGKTHVCKILEANGCRVIDADTVARAVVEPGQIGLDRIVEHFGEAVLTDDGSLDRPKLGAIVFSDPAKRQLLNSLLHPLVIEAQDEWLKQVESDDPNAIAVVDAALMIESGGYERFDELIVVWCAPEIQLGRLMERNGLSESEARKRIDSQMSQDKKKSYASFLIDTSGSFQDTEDRTLDVLQKLREKI
ncbi:MAG: dephospho-CoA kinase [Acidobacteria bacterium]|nr:MAG: dephospho-CoA kinase [Acidobacteriota bacterium]REK02390.1 MAG: dephospho-CoA kinase [Acidobacteriota bacterium]REK13809.1 MAG: dephospho-CoA kinase [Acidobacteriota bacterium]REK41803.1 MAG: dephospho-CoA kinase [Acidobacteriota bacterium]